MNHLTEEELVERYYGERGSGMSGAYPDTHLQECEQCTGAFAALEGELAAMRPLDVPERDENYGERMWARVEGALPPRHAKKSWVRRVGWQRVLIYAASCAVLVAGSFYGGEVYEHWQTQKRMRTTVHAPAPQPKVVVVVLGDHLDRSERLLVELKHADADTAELSPLRDEAQNLLTPNRVFRDEAEKEGDPALTIALNHLDTLLTEIANQPGGLDASGLARVRNEMNADGLLFEVRVLRSKDPHRTKAVRVLAKGGVA